MGRARPCRGRAGAQAGKGEAGPAEPAARGACARGPHPAHGAPALPALPQPGLQGTYLTRFSRPRLLELLLRRADPLMPLACDLG